MPRNAARAARDSEDMTHLSADALWTSETLRTTGWTNEAYEGMIVATWDCVADAALLDDRFQGAAVLRRGRGRGLPGRRLRPAGGPGRLRRPRLPQALRRARSR